MKWMNNDEYERWFTFQEVFNRINKDYPLIFPPSPYYSEISSSWWTTALNTLSIPMNYQELSSNISSSNINDIINYLMNIVYNRYSKFYLCGIIVNEDRDMTLQEARDSLVSILNVLVNTLPKYIPLFIANKASNANLLAKPESTSTSKSRFNDTPQHFGNTNVDSYTTNATYNENKVESDLGTLMTRLSEAYKNFHSITLDWSNEFNMLFIAEEQL